MPKLATFRSVVAAVAASMLLGAMSPSVRADIPGATFAETIDPSPGTDVFAPQHFRLNHATHKLYVAGLPSDSTRNFGLKVIDTTSFNVITGIDLGRYASQNNGFYPLGFDVDESPAPTGDKVYIVGRLDTGATGVLLRVIDGPTNSNLTSENNGDLFLPMAISGDEGFKSLAVNSANHKVYVAKENGEIVVVDGPNRQVLTTLNPNLGNFLIASPGTNRIFVVNKNGGGLINSADDSFTQLSLSFTATAAALDPIHGRIYFVGKAPDNSNAIYVVDAASGNVVNSKTGLAAAPLSVAVDPNRNTVYVGSATDLLSLDATDLSEKARFIQPAARLACDPAVSAGVFFLEDYQVTQRRNLVFSLNPDNAVVTQRAVGYRPFEIAVNSRTNRVYVTDEQTPELLAIDRNANGAITRIPITSPASIENLPHLERFQPHVTVSERLNRIYIPRRARDSSSGSFTFFIDVFDGATNQFLRSIALDPSFTSAGRVAVDDTRRRIYISVTRNVSSQFDVENLLLIYDEDTETRITSISLGKDFLSVPGSVAVNPVTGRVYVTAAPGTLIFDGNTNTKVGEVSSVGGSVINRRTNRIYGRTNSSRDALGVIDGATDSLETTFPIQNNGDYFTDFDADEVTNRVYVTHATQDYSSTGRVTAYDANNNYQFLGQIDLAIKPTRITFASAARQFFVSHDLDGVISVFQTGEPAPADLFGNISTRAHVGSGDDALIGGFIITGTQLKTVLVRGIGPSLPVPGALEDPVIEVHGSSGELLATNDNWKDATTKQQIIDSGLAPDSELESALWGTINPGAYTVVVRGKNNAAGIALFEVYDLDGVLPQRLANISTRGHVDSGDNVMIAGMIVVGSKPVQAVVRAIGPSLANVGVSNPLEDPLLELRDTNGGLITSNDDWQEHEAEVNAASLAPTDPRESAIVATLYPANYTAVVRGKNGATGVALVEAYHLSVGQ